MNFVTSNGSDIDLPAITNMEYKMNYKKERIDIYNTYRINDHSYDGYEYENIRVGFIKFTDIEKVYSKIQKRKNETSL